MKSKRIILILAAVIVVVAIAAGFAGGEDKIHGKVVDKHFQCTQNNPMRDVKISARLLLTVECRDGHIRSYFFSNDYVANMLNKKYKIGDEDSFPTKAPYVTMVY